MFDKLESVEKRYEELKGHVEISERPDIVEIERMMSRTNSERAQAIVEWHDRKVMIGEEYTYAQMREALSLEQRQIEYATENWRCLRNLLNAERLPNSRNRFKKTCNWFFEDIFEDFGDAIETVDDE